MEKSVVYTSAAPAAVGPYSQAIAAGDLIFLSGQLPLDPETGRFPSEDVAEQTAQSLQNIRAVLAQAGLTLDAVVKTTVLLQDIADFDAMNKVYASFFTTDCPARSAFQVAALPKGAKVEIEAVAVR
ncbi:MAG: RidA family protein [Gemmiger sp.]|uniref:RidA family protein n=1 Tax=Gemmiger sp. TaxID=2049027 RepID=UPI002E78CAF6|nr:RidA family protein [Gemmiger sp.]MEE0799739.1 RidA family protein [Gemmiger sp.]